MLRFRLLIQVKLVQTERVTCRKAIFNNGGFKPITFMENFDVHNYSNNFLNKNTPTIKDNEPYISIARSILMKTSMNSTKSCRSIETKYVYIASIISAVQLRSCSTLFHETTTIVLIYRGHLSICIQFTFRPLLKW